AAGRARDAAAAADRTQRRADRLRRGPRDPVHEPVLQEPLRLQQRADRPLVQHRPGVHGVRLADRARRGTPVRQAAHRGRLAAAVAAVPGHARRRAPPGRGRGAFWLRATFMQVSTPLIQAYNMEVLPQNLRARSTSLTNMLWNLGWAASATLAGW